MYKSDNEGVGKTIVIIVLIVVVLTVIGAVYQDRQKQAQSPSSNTEWCNGTECISSSDIDVMQDAVSEANKQEADANTLY